MSEAITNVRYKSLGHGVLPIPLRQLHVRISADEHAANDNIDGFIACPEEVESGDLNVSIDTFTEDRFAKPFVFKSGDVVDGSRQVCVEATLVV